MTIDEAIEILLDQASKGFHFPDAERKEASRLGAESLRKWKVLREGRAGVIDPLLPGETE